MICPWTMLLRPFRRRHPRLVYNMPSAGAPQPGRAGRRNACSLSRSLSLSLLHSCLVASRTPPLLSLLPLLLHPFADHDYLRRSCCPAGASRVCSRHRVCATLIRPYRRYRVHRRPASPDAPDSANAEHGTLDNSLGQMTLISSWMFWLLGSADQ